MSNYYDMQEGKVNIAHALMARGWKVYGYHADDSDMMTDYYSPAHWGGIATKNGFILVVDNNTDHKEEEIKQYNSNGNISSVDYDKITKLQQMTVEHGCTESEAETAKKLIIDLQSKTKENQDNYIVIGSIPAYMGNPGKCKWHIEKDGIIYDKGTGITKYADIPSYGFNVTTEQYEKGFDTWSDGTKKTLSDDELKAIKDVKSLILRFERVFSGINSCGDGTAETEAQAAEQIKNESAPMEKIIEKVTKKVIKPVEKENKTICIGDVLSLSQHCHYWVVTDIWNNNKGIECVTYELLGSEKRGYQRLNGTSAKRYYQTMPALEKQITEGKTNIYTLQEVEEVKEVEKWVKKTEIKQNKESNKTNENQKAETEPPQNQINNNLEYDIKQDVDTRDNSIIFVVKIIKKLSKDDYIKANEYMRSIGGYYSKFKSGFIFKHDPTEILNGDKQTNTTEKEIIITVDKNLYEHEKIEDGFIYDCHFKSWNMTMEEIQEEIKKLNLSYNDMIDKIGFTNLTADQTKQIKEISDKNGSIFFIDSKQPESVFTPVIIGNYEISQATNENKKIFIVKVIKTLSKSEYEKVNTYMQKLGANYNKFFHGFVFTENPIELLQTVSAA